MAGAFLPTTAPATGDGQAVFALNVSVSSLSELPRQLETWSCPFLSIAICSTPCQNGGMCTAPNTCSCTAGWTGSVCHEGEISATCSCNNVQPKLRAILNTFLYKYFMYSRLALGALPYSILCKELIHGLQLFTWIHRHLASFVEAHDALT